MSAARRYILALDDFDAPPVPVAPPPDPLPGLLRAARDEAFAQGVAAGEAAMRDAIEARATAALASLHAGIDAARAEARAVAEAAAHETARALFAALSAALPALSARHGEAEVARFAEALLPALADEAAVALHVAPDLAPTLAARFAGAARLEVLPDPALPPGDARLMWRQGCAERRLSAARAALDALLADHSLS